MPTAPEPLPKPGPLTPTRARTPWGLILAVAAVYLGAAKLGLTMAFVAEQVTAVWPPTGIALAALLVSGYRVWPGVALGAFLANATTNAPPGTAFGIAVGNTLEAVVGTWMLRRFVHFDCSLERLKDVLGLVTLAAVLSTSVSATVGVTSLCLGGVQPWAAYGPLWRVWWLGDATSALVVAPVLLTGARGRWGLWRVRRFAEAAALAAALVFVTLAVFAGSLTPDGTTHALGYVIFPFIIWAALRFGQAGTAAATFVASAVAIWGTVNGLGPFAKETVNESLILLQLFMAVVAVTGLLLGAAIAERKLAEERQSLLAEAGRILGSSLDYEATLANVCELVVPGFADWCALDLLTDEGRVRRLAVARKGHDTSELAYAFPEPYPCRPDDDPEFPKGLRTAEPESDPDASDERFVEGGRNPGHLDTLGASGGRSVITVPLTARGRTLGAMTLAAEPSRRFGDGDLHLARELGSRAALAVDNARLFSEGQEAARRREEALSLHQGIEEKLTLLVEASGSLSVSPDLDSVLTAILGLSRRLVAADAYAVWRHDAATGHWRIGLASGLSQGYQQSTIRVLRDTPTMPETPIIAEDVLDAPLLGQREKAYEAEGIRSLLAVPLKVRGTTSGTLVFYYKRPHRFTEIETRVATALSNLAASAIGTAELHEELTANDRRKDEFLAMLAHELRNPLSAITNAIQVAKTAGADDQQEWSREVIERQVKHFARLIDDLLDVSRITRGKIRLKTQALELGRVVNNAVESVRPLVRERNHQLTVSLAPQPLWLEGDPVRLEQIVVNLLTNAAKYTESGGRIWLTTGREGENVLVSVRDTGIGIPSEKLPRMFELFVQGDRSLARSEGGLGIGLTLVKSLTEMHGGGVTAKSDGDGRGSEFVVSFPAAVAEVTGPEPGASPDRKVGRCRRILVVDDNADTVRGMARLLKLLGHDVRTAPDGPSALEAAMAHRPEFVLLDIGLPGMDGYQVASRLKRDGNCKEAVIIAVSGYGQDEDRRRSREAGFDHHLVKPVDHDALVTLLSQPGAAASRTQ